MFMNARKSPSFRFGILLLTVLLVAGCSGGLPAATNPPVASSTVAVENTPTLPPATSTPQPTAPPAATETQSPAAASSPTPAELSADRIQVANLSELESVNVSIKGVVNAIYWPEAAQALVEINREVFTLDLETLKVNPEPIEDFPDGLAVSADGRYVLYQAGSGGVFLQDRVDGTDRVVPKAGVVVFASFSQDGKRFVINSQEGIGADVWDVQSLTQVASLKGFETAAPVFMVHLDSHGEKALWTARPSLQVQDVSSGELGEKMQFADFIQSAGFTIDSRWVVVLFAGGMLVLPIEDLEGGALTLIQPGGADFVSSFALSNDGALLAAAVGERIQFWDTTDWSLSPVSLTVKAEDTQDSLRLLGFSPDGTHLAAQRGEGDLIFWKLP